MNEIVVIFGYQLFWVMCFVVTVFDWETILKMDKFYSDTYLHYQVHIPKLLMKHPIHVDLRQDMLTLQVIGMMAQLWNNEGLDLRMVPYSCLSMGKQVGVIEVVRNAKTVYSIQRVSKLGAMQVDSSQLYKWIRDKNQGLRWVMHFS